MARRLGVARRKEDAMRRGDPDYVVGEQPPYQIQPNIVHPAFCVCAKCIALPENERDRQHVLRMRRRSPYRNSRVQSAVYALRVKKEEETKLAAAVAAALAPTAGKLGAFEPLAKRYLAEHPMPKSTEVKHKQILRQHLVPFFGPHAIADFKPLLFSSYQRSRGGSVDAPTPKNATINRELTLVVAVLNFGERNGLIERNPIRRGAFSRLPVCGPRTAFFEPEEWRAFISAFADEDTWQRYLERAAARKSWPKMVRGLELAARTPDSSLSSDVCRRLHEITALWEILLHTGSRLMEIAMLRCGKIDLRRRLATIYQAKTKREKTIPLNSRAAAILEPILANKHPHAYVLTRSDGQPFYETELQRAFRIALDVARLRKPLSPHSIRHTTGSWLAIAGVPKEHRDEILGHARNSVGDGYSHLLAPLATPGDREAGPHRAGWVHRRRVE